MTIDFPKRSHRLASLILGYTAVPSEASTTSRVAGTRAVVLRDSPLSLDGIQCVPSGSFSALADCGLHRLRVSGLWTLKNFWSYFHLVKQTLVKPAPVKPAHPTPRTDLTKKVASPRSCTTGLEMNSRQDYYEKCDPSARTSVWSPRDRMRDTSSIYTTMSRFYATMWPCPY